ncbi:altered inheritance of mitochondria protein 3 [Galendromus occidentalis]|uniref:Altered inheritance of mitochondria protein 3 n=1 Tax=Galendromus occidentalis TaxID=34638 RepID=A0AAJ7PAL7_9ACAR|nr:altered inheritance of mitochondria protein 3 [Galendromus occidentalis]
MKRLVVFFCSVALCHSQFAQGQYNPFQYNAGYGTNSRFPSFPARDSFGANRGFDLFSSNTLNNNNFFRQPQQPQNGFQTASQNAYSSFSGFPFTSGTYNAQNPAQSSNPLFSTPANLNYLQPQFNAAQQTYQQTFQPPAPQTTYQAPPPPPPPQQPAYQPPVQQQAYQAPAPAPYQAPYQPQPAFQQPTAPRSAPYVNTAQLSYNAAAPAQNPGSSNLPSGSSPTDKPAVYHPPAPVHYVSIGQKLEGDYKFGYETGKGSNGDESFRSETRDADGTVRGSYGYVDSNGKQITVHYEAGREGFKILSEDEAKNGKRPAPPQQQGPAQQLPQPRSQPAPQPSSESSAPAPAASNESAQSSPQRRRYSSETPASPSANLAVSQVSPTESTTYGPPVIDVNQLSYNIGTG